MSERETLTDLWHRRAKDAHAKLTAAEAERDRLRAQLETSEAKLWRVRAIVGRDPDTVGCECSNIYCRIRAVLEGE